jgi:hypothetical protein
MSKLPEKHSPRWFGITALLFLLLLAGLILARMALGMAVGLSNGIGFAVIALLAALAAGAGGFLGGKIYFVVVCLSYLLGTAYMLFIAARGLGEGWGDLISVISFLFIAACGIGAGLLIQFGAYLTRKKA